MRHQDAAPDNMARIIIFYLIRNSGHHAAARALESGIKLLKPKAEILCMDPLEYMHPRLSATVTFHMLFVVKRAPELWDALYDKKRAEPLVNLFQALANRATDSLLDVIRRFSPDAIVCTQAYPLALMSAMRRKFHTAIPMFGVVTDLRVHRFWSQGNHPAYIVPNEEAAHRLVSLGIRRDRIHVIGIPISPTFEANAQFGAERPAGEHARILVMGGSRGMGPDYRTIRRLDQTPKPFIIDAITGMNRRLANRLVNNRRDFVHPVRIRGFVRNVAPLFARATLLVSKPGGLTCAEAMAAGLPMLIAHPLPGQEQCNTEELVAHGAALHIEKDRDLPAVLTALLDNPEMLAMMRRRALELARPSAARDAARLILSSCGA